VQVKKDEVAARVDQRARERDIRRALRAADDAEQFAVDSARIAQVAIQNAWVSVLAPGSGWIEYALPFSSNLSASA